MDSNPILMFLLCFYYVFIQAKLPVKAGEVLPENLRLMREIRLLILMKG